MLELIVSLSIQPYLSNKQDVFSDLDNNAVHYIGEIEERKNEMLTQILEEHPDQVKLLLIKSRGGDVEYGMELGKIVYQHNLDVKVKGTCNSSCANYVLTAAKNKYIGDNVQVIWHGGTLQEFAKSTITLAQWNVLRDFSETCEPQQLFEEWFHPLNWLNTQLLTKECEFFKYIGVDIFSTVYGLFPFNYKSTSWWTYSTAAMEKFAITNVFASSNYGASYEYNVFIFKSIHQPMPSSIMDYAILN